MEIIYKKIRNFFTIILVFLLTGNLYSGEYKTVGPFFGDWKIKKIQEYRGSLEFASKKEAEKKNLGKIVSIQKNQLVMWYGTIKNPQYSSAKVDNTFKKGEIGDKRYSSFYDFETKRKFIPILNVFNKKKIYIWFEILSSNKLLLMYDGFFYFLEKQKR